MKYQRVGVIGGGQLAWMMGAEAPSLELKLIVQTPNQDDPAVERTHYSVLAKIDDATGTEKLAKICDVITFENEFIDLQALQELEKQGVKFRPSLATLAPLLDKYDQRNYLKSIGVLVPEFSLYSTSEDIISNYGFPVVLKARRHGYDGQGTFIIKDLQHLHKLAKTVPVQELLVEKFIPFTKELAVIAARNQVGDIAVYPVTETYQKNQVCHWTITPADVAEEVAPEVTAIAKLIVNQLQVVGVLGIEFFLTADNQVLVNEIAPRTHNSGHYSLDACDTSQFAMQLRAVADLPLGSTNLKSAMAVMVNLLGYEDSEADYQDQRDRLNRLPHAYVHWYGKSSRLGRKLGHVTALLSKRSPTQAQEIIEQIEAIWYGNSRL